MRNLNRLSPMHIKVRALWMRNARRISQAEKVAAAIAQLQSTWREFAECRREENEVQDQQTIDAEFELDLHIGKVRVFDWHWLKETFEAFDLGNLQLAICEQQFPEKSWEIVENDTHTVVADRERFHVCDLLLESDLSAAASLVLAGDPTFAGWPAVQAEVNRFEEARMARQQWQLNAMKAQIERYSQEGSVSPLRRG